MSKGQERIDQTTEHSPASFAAYVEAHIASGHTILTTPTLFQVPEGSTVTLGPGQGVSGYSLQRSMVNFDDVVELHSGTYIVEDAATTCTVRYRDPDKSKSQQHYGPSRPYTLTVVLRRDMDHRRFTRYCWIDSPSSGATAASATAAPTTSGETS